MKTIKLYRDLLPEDVEVDLDWTLAEARNRFNLPPKDEKNSWIFFDTSIDADAMFDRSHADYGQAFYKIREESNTTVRQYLDLATNNRNNEMYVVNQKRKPSVTGVRTNKFRNHLSDCEICLNDARNAPFNPLMLRNVNVDNGYWETDKIVVFPENTPICFKLHCNEWSAFGFSIKPEVGDAIWNEGYCTDGKMATVWTYEDKSSILITPTKQLGISNEDSLQYQRVRIEMWKVHSYQRNGIFEYGVNPKLTTTLSPELDWRINFGESNSNDQISKKISIEGGDIESAMPKKGEQVDVNFGEISHVREDRKNILGVFEISFFVFKSIALAHKYVDVKTPTLFN